MAGLAVTLSWIDNSSFEKQFEVGLFGKVVRRVAANTTAVDIADLDAGISYHWDVRACGLVACSPWHGVVGRTADGGHPGHDRSPAWSPDGRRLAFTSNRSGTFDVWVMNADGSGAVNLTSSPGDEDGAAWSRDGSRIAFASNRGGGFDIYVMRADGSGLVRLTSDGADNLSPARSPDDARIAFSSRRDGDADVFVMDADGSGSRNLTRRAGFDGKPKWSADGARIVFESERGGGLEVISMAPDGSDVRNLTSIHGKDMMPDWGFPPHLTRAVQRQTPARERFGAENLSLPRAHRPSAPAPGR